MHDFAAPDGQRQALGENDPLESSPLLRTFIPARRSHTIFTLSSDPTFFHTESFSSSDSRDIVDGDSGSLADKIDVDVPLGKRVYGHELRTGGFFSRTELFGDLREGLDAQHLYEVHGRLVLDFLNQLWKVQWMGIGGSYIWGSNFSGWTVGADVSFHF